MDKISILHSNMNKTWAIEVIFFVVKKLLIKKINFLFWDVNICLDDCLVIDVQKRRMTTNTIMVGSNNNDK